MGFRVAIILCLGFLAAGCATNRGIVDVRVPETTNPETSATVKIMKVTDRRVFQVKPNSPSIPSLRNDEINDPAITKRALARKRNTYGMALGDILLPPDRTVEHLTREALERGVKGIRLSHRR